MGGQSVSQVVILSTGERFTQQNCPAGLSAAAAAAAWYFREAWPAWYWSCPRLRPALHATAQGRQPGEISRHSSRQKDLPGPHPDNCTGISFLPFLTHNIQTSYIPSSWQNDWNIFHVLGSCCSSRSIRNFPVLLLPCKNIRTFFQVRSLPDQCIGLAFTHTKDWNPFQCSRQKTFLSLPIWMRSRCFCWTKGIGISSNDQRQHWLHSKVFLKATSKKPRILFQVFNTRNK